MANAVKKKGKNRRLKRSVRKTLGALFLASALAVAAIPTEGLQAAGDDTIMALANTPTYKSGSVTVDDIFAYVPKVVDTATIYTTGDSRFQFAYVSPNTGQETGTDNRVAVILGYNDIGHLEGGSLAIPNEVEAYKKYAFGTTTGDYAAVNMDGEYLYYMRWINRTDAQGNIMYEMGTVGDPDVDQYGYKIDANGNRIPQKVEQYKPCYYTDRSTWVSDTTLYVNTGTSVSGGNSVPVYAPSARERIRAATVAYIGSQYLKEDNGTWTIAGVVDEKEDGIFYGVSNINTLSVGKDLQGIGNYAFAGCAGLNSITLENGLKGMGNSAFEDCVNLSTVNIAAGAPLPVIGSRCFYNCQKLNNFELPYGTNKIGDEAFAGCTGMETINLISTQKDENGQVMNGLLNEIGNGVFRDCSRLKSITFPSTFNNNGKGVDVSEFQGCTALQYIKTDGNTSFDLTTGNCSTFDFAKFKEMVPATFYLEGPKNETLHGTATRERIAFRFYDSGLDKFVYELVVEEADGKTATYWVDDNNQLVKCDMAKGMEIVTLPETIGPKSITSVGSTTFQNKCALRRITIPASVTSIAENAFKGCHHLEDVIFTNALNIQSIGRGAFSTQEVVLHTDCPNETQNQESYLNFTGTISAGCVPFQYAMNPSEYINTASQYRTYITYYSGWPTNLEVKYNETTGLNELINYPTLSDLKSGVYTQKKAGANSNEYVYAYMTPEFASAAMEALGKYESGANLTDYEKQIINAALALELPDGIESIATVDAQGNHVEDPGAGSGSGSVSGGDVDSGYRGLFTYKEAADKVWGSKAYKSLTTEGLLAVNAGAFKDCDTITSVTFKGSLKSIGNYAFEGCDNLSAVSVSESTTELGLRPFTKCTSLAGVNFNGSQHFTCEDSIIYTLDSGGNKEALVEFLCKRGVPTIEASELAGVKSIYPEAFMDTGVKTVDLSQTQITSVPENAFRRTKDLFRVDLPNTCKSISKGAFTDSGLFQITIPRSVGVIHNESFGDVDGGEYEGMTDLSQLVFYTPEDSFAAIFAEENNITRKDFLEPIYHKVTFFGWDGTVLGTMDVEEGKAAVPAFEIPAREGYTFSGWMPPVDCITDTTTTTAQYTPIDPDTLKVTVKFIVRFPGEDPVTLKEVRLAIGETAEPPKDPVREGYIFLGWQGNYANVQKDEEVYAYFEKRDSTSTQHIVRFLDWNETVLSVQRVDDGKDAIIPRDPVREGYTFDKWLPSPTNVTKDLDVYAMYTQGSDNSGDNGNNGNNGNGSSSGNGSDNNGNNGNGTTSGNGSGSDGSTSKFYTLTVQNGSGSGSYVAGAQPIVIANDPSSTQEFSHWTIDPENTTIASKVLSATVITMPEGNVTVTAHYRARSSSSNGSGSSSSANSGGRPNNTGTISNGGTTVVIDKNGISNTGVVAATVNGSSDNFVIKITESSEASEAVVRALMAEYGSLDNIKYFPMDISLYDSTGTNKITDTTGLSVDITLPLPDSLITYAGNNRVAGVVNDRLDKLTPKFTTISGVSCITFRAEHFSPYVIYVDTANLSAGGSADSTPKTGDGIHPKWFLSVGLACLSFVMFMQKDKRKPQKVKVKAKAKA